MRLRIALVSGAMMVALVGCNQTTHADRKREEKADETARQAGRAAYQAAEQAKQAAKQAQDAAEDLNRKLEKASDEVRKGWDDAKREHEQQQKQ